MADVEKARYKVAEWLATCQTRFYNMYKAQLDPNGWPALQKALKNYDERGYLTVGEVQYLFNRTHPLGAYSDYNTHRGYNKKFGNMMQCPIKELIDSNTVNWRTGANGVIHGPLTRAIDNETNWRWHMGNLRPKQNTTFSDLFD